MTLQEAIDNAPSWARWLGVDENGTSGAYFSDKPEICFGGWSAVYSRFEELDPTMFDNGPQLIEVNK